MSDELAVFRRLFAAVEELARRLRNVGHARDDAPVGLS